ncbi:histidinol dehydrogenase [Natrinema sp. 1APR25-10V2]|uniref:histidinol dehydrogenase n=1 Tax=Natrinema sp. 1APR25-10V2 TaxID=2951081 RepID=UPI002874FF88|nr:histidinol dehydrogenase [Natrinema sp. 1APR25-10V2]MDS0477020.1 histidinol dehydrogenase [Natrinema sp. 1APR25-10V2]
MSTTVEYLKQADDASIEIDRDVTDAVRDILSGVRDRGDDALFEFTERFDGVEVDDFRVSDDEIEAAAAELTAAETEAIENTIENVRAFHEEQREHIEGFEKEFEEGVRLGQRIVPVESAGTYVPGGRHPLVAAPAMSIVPAEVAGVDRIVTCAPPQDDGGIQPAQLYAMDRAGADEIYRIGGAQAIGAMAYGTETVPEVAKITGPGNVFTTEAKRQVFGHVGIDFLAGPTEVLILTDETADPELVATDLLAQAEHDPNSRPILVSTDQRIAEEAVDDLYEQLPDLRTEDVARECWEENGEVIVAETLDDAVAVANDYAIEHLQVMIDEPRSIVDDLTNYGSLFLGDHSPVVFGDKAVGTNHSLPTLEVARYSGGIWVGTYLKTLTHQEATEEGAARVAPLAAKICELEGTHAHQLSAEARLRPDVGPDYGQRE